jgi:glycerol kinase
MAIDQGTTSSRAILFDHGGNIIAMDQKELQQHFPGNGLVEHNACEIWSLTLDICHGVLRKAGATGADITGIGITNQRETAVLWDRATGEPVHMAIVWQDRRTASVCQQLQADGHEPIVTDKTGLLLDPYFTATKLTWLLDNVPGARERAEKGELAFGTIDTWLLWNLTGGQSHLTDATNASRTLLFNIHTQDWDDDLLALFRVPRAILPEVRDCASDFGSTKADIFGVPVPIGGIAGDQQAALFGQACFEPGMAKSTYGTGCFLILNTGEQIVRSHHRLLTTVGYRLNGKPTYAIEGSIFIAGATIQWLRDGLKLISSAGETEMMARKSREDCGVYLVPAFTGLGAPYWDPQARGAIIGLTRSTGIENVVAAGLHSVGYQTRDLTEAIMSDVKSPLGTIRVDGGMVKNNLVTQFLANILGVNVDRPVITETTALGVAYLAGLQTGVFGSLEEIAGLWQKDRTFKPEMDEAQRQKLYDGWRDAVRRVMTTEKAG